MSEDYSEHLRLRQETIQRLSDENQRLTAENEELKGLLEQQANFDVAAQLAEENKRLTAKVEKLKTAIVQAGAYLSNHDHKAAATILLEALK